MRCNFLLLAFCLFAIGPLSGQSKPKLTKPNYPASPTPESLLPVAPVAPAVPLAPPIFFGENNFQPIGILSKPVGVQSPLQVYVSPESGTPYLIKGTFKTDAGKSLEEKAGAYFEEVNSLLKLKNPAEEFQLRNVSTEPGFEHLDFQQVWLGVPVYGAEAKLHFKDGEAYLFNGRYYPSPQLTDVTPTISEETAGQLALEEASLTTTVKDLTTQEKQLSAYDQAKATLVIYHPNPNTEEVRLAWHVIVIPNITHRYACFIDAETGEVLKSYSELCQLVHFMKNSGRCQNFAKIQIAAPETNKLFTPDNLLLDGPATANAIDLFGITRTIDTYDVGGTFYLIDASRSMFSFPQSNLPDDPVGSIWTIDGLNDSPENNSFQVTHLQSSDNAWNNPVAVSAHYNGGLAYEYYKNTFGRESINGQGGNIISLINITESDGQQMDNAFWNGLAMFYGNGDVAFDEPLAKAPDVAGHEMTHGVVQATANLEYLGESGALNESFADVFGAMIDRDDWTIGEDIANNSIFPTGALRDMANPNNGGSSLNDNGYQPDHYNDRYLGNDDNGGVHINSGIPNKAFQLFAEAIGKNKAEQVYYRALNEYLFKSALFVDCRIAVEQAAADLYGNAEVNAAQNAFSAVGIGSGGGTNSQTDNGENPGDDFILMTDDNFDQLYIYTPEGVEVANPLSFVSPLSRPSITDDGSSVVYIADDNTMRAIGIDWQSGSLDPQVIQSEPIWRNVAISKDGRHLAALTTDNDNQLWIYDYSLAQWESYELFNPTTGQGGPTTGDVLYADVLEWDVTGEWVMYDALNRINTTGSSDIEYWDISFAKVWDNAGDGFGSGFTSKLFNGLPEDVSVGNPTFSKNSDYIIAFDYIDNFNQEYYLRAANLETGDQNTIFQNSDLSWPNYSTDDTQMVFEANDNYGTPVLAFVPLGDDKISPNGSATVYLGNKRWGVWFANGDRILVGTDESFAGSGITVFPNPTEGSVTLKWTAVAEGQVSIQLFDMLGKKIRSTQVKVRAGNMQEEIDLANVPSGQYLVQVLMGGKSRTLKVVKR